MLYDIVSLTLPPYEYEALEDGGVTWNVTRNKWFA